MKKNARLITTGILSMAIVAPTMAFATESNAMENNDNLNINLEKKSIVLGSTSKVSVKFKEKPDADSITLKYKCYDMPLDTTLNYNQSTGLYEGTINYNKDPEYLNVWELQGITINSATNPKTLDRQELEAMGLNLKDYDVTQECIIEDITSRKDVSKYMRKTSAPITELTGSDRYETAVKISKEGWKNGSDKVIIISGDVSIDGIISTPLATTYNAPILLVEKNNVPASVKAELKRLNPKDVIIIGDENSISKTTANQIKSTVSASQTRLNGSNRYETSLLIAKEIDKNHDVDKVYITNANGGEVDALTIAAKAGQDKQPIILSDKDSLTNDTYKWLQSEDLQSAYFIGGPQMLSTNVINKINDITKDSVTKNRVYGADRHETNANVIKTFYTEDELEAVLVAKSDVLVDALAAGPLAASLKSPILITPKTYVSAYHKDNLEAKSANKVYKIGGGLTSKVMNSIAASLSKHNTTPTDPGTNNGAKTVMIDPGHGGSDTGTTGKPLGGIKEKDYTLNTSLATTEYLRSKGINVIMTRDTDKTLSLGNRTALSNSLRPDLFTSIHYNASDTTGNGVEVFYKLADKNGGTTKTVATNILNRILEKFNLKNRGIKTRTLSTDPTKDYLYVLRTNDMPAVLVECAFLDNEKDMSLLNTSSKVKDMGTQIGKGIEESLK
ncbi:MULTISPECIES: N-acetylmuramoyl-L-alanine amidase [unclassified Clostridioides]|uniref:N-acetylmuramoyl-L-alanine amidase n=1 Tax=unclassified Clostridioides TaxID=2635829 RepID=UPI001D1284F9|nr:N-acetylmuramoyl-L-alanine amidase [Clostridioides sp. ZZV14-6154]MCC0717583.1 N-acetylmuramoyl-L-alanine amidase [Clostridioides sp. ZZV14-6105]MCC0725279.1 N-acetylmuramoyl-L-alanine amidase [Clostridioides sp. ZZV14-6045]MCC0729023.1 N-acetylmuramoyl-L-alanine amidase [Clostridioides sp. ZZV14-6048]MCC0734226.1 N-acetylmuramoyl-L-alanine amidase [Clostridioides sp. ZZV14-6009]MCC0737447.1 N-acetylmuramoyl-L-alanine amidase [Clostridioides sp. ZZV14-5902]WLD27261.1 N-acetylmuramoyl-L-ala